MSEIRYVAKVLENGALSAPAEVDLEVGQEVRVILRVREKKHAKKKIDPLKARMSPEAWKTHQERQQKLDELMARFMPPAGTRL